MKRLGLVLLLGGIYAPAASGLENAKLHRPAPRPVVSAPTEAPPPAEAPPYEGQLLKLSELMGTVAFLADLCPDLHDPDQNGEMWRQKAKGLLDAESNNDTLKALLAGAYNRGYAGYEVNYHLCTDTARLSFKHALAAINSISRTLTRKYSGN